MTDPRPDLSEALIRSCWLVESARACVFAAWGPEFAEQARRTRMRADQIASSVGITGPTELVDAHAAWMRSVVGSTPDEVPLGAALLQRLGEWTNVYIVPFLTEPGEFMALGEGELLFPVPPRALEHAEAFLRPLDPGPAPRFVILTDLHMGTRATPELIEAAVRDVNQLRPSFVVVPGDVTDDGEPEQFDLAAKVLSGLDAPCHAVLGNHDAVRRSTRLPEGHRLFERSFGRPPSDTVLECGAWQIALMDSTDPVPSPFPDWDLARGGFREDAGGTNGGALRPGQASALAGALDPARPSLLITHHELQPFAAFPPVMFGLRDADSEELLSALGGHRLAGVIAGHTHRSAFTTVAGGLPQLEVPAAKDWPFCYTVVSVTDDEAHATVHQISDRDLVWRVGETLSPIYLRYATGPDSHLAHTFRVGPRSAG